jgi:putative ABC transport system substrate-binding protein
LARYRAGRAWRRFLAGRGCHLNSKPTSLTIGVLRGENPGEIPIYQSARFNLAINLKTAKALGLVIPASMVARADLVIE